MPECAEGRSSDSRAFLISNAGQSCITHLVPSLFGVNLLSFPVCLVTAMSQGRFGLRPCLSNTNRRLYLFSTSKHRNPAAGLSETQTLIFGSLRLRRS